MKKFYKGCADFPSDLDNATDAEAGTVKMAVLSRIETCVDILEQKFAENSDYFFGNDR